MDNSYPPQVPAFGGIPPQRPLNVGLLLGAVFALVGLALLTLTAFLWLHERSFLARAEHTRGLVVAMDARWSGNSTSSGTSSSNRRSNNTPTYAPTFTFADKEGNEHRVRSSSSTNPPSYQVGENVEVIYDPKSPDNAELRGFFSQWGAVTICGGLGAVFGLVGVVVSTLAKMRGSF